MSKGKKVLAWTLGTIGVLALVSVGLGLGMVARILKPGAGERGGIGGFFQRIQDARQIAIAPKQGFPGQNKLVILGMGIDDNWTDKDEVYTHNARTDTLFLLTLDLDTKKATMLSIPRDTYTHIAGTKYSSKINSAYTTGGPQRSIATVDELLGVHADHYIVLNIDATQKMVDALGGVDVDVAHEMHYHDKWGHLSIDLMPGQQHLNGQQAVGFARYRHPDKGGKPSPEDGDEHRMARQHLLMQAIVAKGKTFANVAQAPHLIDVAMSSIHTDLTRTQLFDIAAIFHTIHPGDLQSASLPGSDFRPPGGAWDYKLDMDKAKSYVNWLVRGDDSAARGLVSVVIKNGTRTPGLAKYATDQLKMAGFTGVRNGGNAEIPKVQLTGDGSSGLASTTVVDTGVSVPNVPAQIPAALGLTAASVSRQVDKPAKGVAPTQQIVVTLGQDYAEAVKASGGVVPSDGHGAGSI